MREAAVPVRVVEQVRHRAVQELRQVMAAQRRASCPSAAVARPGEQQPEPMVMHLAAAEQQVLLPLAASSS
jgi:hypothetical protein